MNDIILGIDGGGTKTKIVAVDRSANVIATSIGESLNYNFISMDKAVVNILDNLKNLKLPPESIIRAVSIGNPAMDDICSDNLPDIFIEKLKKADIFNSDTHFFIKSDVFMALYGLTMGREGALIISGTGSMGVAIDKDSNIHVVGGWGKPTNDDGSGYFIAVEGIKAALGYNDGILPYTSLLKEVQHFFGVAKPRELINIFNDESCKNSDIAAFAKIVSNCSIQGDKVAGKILNKAADILASYAISLVRKINSANCSVGMFGGVFLNDNYVREYFTNKVKSIYPLVDIKIPHILPEYAAALYALNKLEVNYE